MNLWEDKFGLLNTKRTFESINAGGTALESGDRTLALCFRVLSLSFCMQYAWAHQQEVYFIRKSKIYTHDKNLILFFPGDFQNFLIIPSGFPGAEWFFFSQNICLETDLEINHLENDYTRTSFSPSPLPHLRDAILYFYLYE